MMFGAVVAIKIKKYLSKGNCSLILQCWLVEHKYCVVVFFLSLTLQLLALLAIGIPMVEGDDTWAATSIVGNTLDNIIFTLRFDLHPPIYYMFMDMWGGISKTDFWLTFNSIFLHSLLCSSVYHVTNNLFGKRIAFVSVLLVFSSPLLLEYAIRLRMYSLISLLSLWAFYLSHHWFNDKHKRHTKTLFLINLLLANLHAVGILFVFSHFFYGLIKGVQIKKAKLLYQWIAVFFGVFILTIPSIGNSFLKSVTHAIAPKLSSFHEIIIDVLFNFYYLPSLLAISIALVMSFMILKEAKTRYVFIAYVVIPLVLFALISIFIKPMWLNRNFAFMIPMFSILTAWCIVTLSEYTRKPITTLLVITCLLVSFNLEKSITKRLDQEQIGLIQLTNFIRTDNPDVKKCFIATSKMINFWQILRYSVDVDWGNSMVVQPPINEKWQQLLNKLPKEVSDGLKLTGANNYFENEKLIVSSGWTRRCLQDDVEELYVVTGSKNELIQPDFENSVKVKLMLNQDFSPFYVYKRLK
jgi:mannosyltransferase